MVKSWHHWSGGLYFGRDEADASVHVRKYDTPGGFPNERHEPPAVEAVIPAEQWCSVMAAVSPRGEDSATYEAARVLHGVLP